MGGHEARRVVFANEKAPTDGGHRIPGIVLFPKKITPNTVIDSHNMVMNWLPTLFLKPYQRIAYSTSQELEIIRTTPVAP